MTIDQKPLELTDADDPIKDLIIGKSAAIKNVIAMARQVALYPTTTVLLLGESGTGKDVIARAIHILSGCPFSRFAPINCAAIPETLLETELFGVEAGAYTDAKASRDGYVARANNGTLFLDEIGSMSLPLQAKLLRFLETRRFCRVGSTKEQRVTLRVISATNVDLEAAVANRMFRDDLFYRLKVITIQIPPLRERKEDIEPLVEYFLHRLSANQVTPLRISDEALALMMRYSWPGNIRELLHVLEGCQIICDDNLILPKDLPDWILHEKVQESHCLADLQQQLHLPAEGVNLPAFLRSIEQSFIREALERCNGNQVHAAALLGFTRDQLRYRMFSKDQ